MLWRVVTFIASYPAGRRCQDNRARDAAGGVDSGAAESAAYERRSKAFGRTNVDAYASCTKGYLLETMYNI